MKILSRLMAVVVLTGWAASASAGLIGLSFNGLVDISGAKIGDVDAPIGSPFSLDIVIDDANAALGTYSIFAIGYTTTVGTYNTIAPSWSKDLLAIQAGASINLVQQDGFFEVNATSEHFGLNLTNFGPSLFDNPLSWTGASITGDIIVRGISGFDSLDQLSGGTVYQGTLSVTVSELSSVPEPSILMLLGLGLLGVAGLSRKRQLKA